MPTIEIMDTGRLDERQSAFPTAIPLADGRIFCAYSVGGGQYATGGSEFSESCDGGRTWQVKNTILAGTESPPTANHMRISLDRDDKTLFAYGAISHDKIGKKFGEVETDAVFMKSNDLGESWTEPHVQLHPYGCPVEVSGRALVTSSGRLLAPAAILPQGRLGEKVILFTSDDQGETWPGHTVAFEDPNGELGYFEHKFTELEPGVIMGVCWTVTFGHVEDRPNSFVISRDDGKTWGPVQSTGTMGQTMTPHYLGDNRLLVLYNRRYGQQGVVMALVEFTDDSWNIVHEALMYDAHKMRQRPEELDDGVNEFADFAFGYPTAVKLQDGTYFATHWCVESDVCGIRWTKLKVNWPQAVGFGI